MTGGRLDGRGAGVGLVTSVLALCLAASWGAPAGGAQPRSDPFFVDFVPNGEAIVVADRRGRILLLGVPGLEVVREFRGDAALKLRGVAISGNGRWLAADFKRGSTRVWSLETGELRLTIPRSKRRSKRVFAFHPNADLLFLFRDGGMEQWDVVGGAHEPIVRSVKWVERMSLSPDGLRLVIYGNYGCKVGRDRFDFCELSLEDGEVAAHAESEVVFEEFQEQRPTVHELVFDDRDEIVVTAEGRRRETYLGDENAYVFATVYLAPSDLSRLDAGADLYPDLAEALEGEAVWRRRGIRSAPRKQSRALSSDGRWQVDLSGGRLQLFSTPAGATDETKSLATSLLLP